MFLDHSLLTLLYAHTGGCEGQERADRAADSGVSSEVVFGLDSPECHCPPASLSWLEAEIPRGLHKDRWQEQVSVSPTAPALSRSWRTRDLTEQLCRQKALCGILPSLLPVHRQSAGVYISI